MSLPIRTGHADRSPYIFEVLAFVDFHLPAGYTMVRTRFAPLAIPTVCIPADLRSIGSRFILVGLNLDALSFADRRLAMRSGSGYVVQRIGTEN